MAIFEQNGNLSYRMAHRLGKEIVNGKYSYEKSLPTEAKLSEEYGVSRTAVREAVKMLSAKGLIRSRPRHGIRILPEQKWNILDSDLLSWSLQGSPSPHVLKEFLQIRIAIEPEAAALAADMATAEDLKEIEAALRRMQSAGENFGLAQNASIEFHMAVFAASHNRFYLQLGDLVRTALDSSLLFSNFFRQEKDTTLDNYTNVYLAIADKDRLCARSAMVRLIKEVHAVLGQ